MDPLKDVLPILKNRDVPASNVSLPKGIFLWKHTNFHLLEFLSVGIESWTSTSIFKWPSRYTWGWPFLHTPTLLDPGFGYFGSTTCSNYSCDCLNGFLSQSLCRSAESGRNAGFMIHGTYLTIPDNLSNSKGLYKRVGDTVKWPILEWTTFGICLQGPANLVINSCQLDLASEVDALAKEVRALARAPTGNRCLETVKGDNQPTSIFQWVLFEP